MRLVAVAAATLTGCAKFPPAGANTNFTKVTFSMTVARQINSDYLYYVAIRASPLVTQDTQGAPQPVFDPSKNPNGFVAGSPTHFVVFVPQNENIEPFVLNRFSLQTEVPNPSDPTNPINLASYARSTRGVITEFAPVTAGTNASPGTSTTLSFSVFVNMLADTDAEAQALQSLQVQMLTMNTTSASGSRVIDFLGTPSQPNFLNIDLRASGMYGNSGGLPGAGIEPTGDCSDPDLDITDWTITVTHS